MRGIVPLNERDHLQATRIRRYRLDAKPVLGEDMVLVPMCRRSRQTHVLKARRSSLHCRQKPRYVSPTCEWPIVLHDEDVGCSDKAKCLPNGEAEAVPGLQLEQADRRSGRACHPLAQHCLVRFVILGGLGVNDARAVLRLRVSYALAILAPVAVAHHHHVATDQAVSKLHASQDLINEICRGMPAHRRCGEDHCEPLAERSAPRLRRRRRALGWRR
mmetsp:Transcript_8558/g.18984  ORF Transcript_8558/g.18984 Transcript_8558/m.18984 type:complete len:217 (-) Transcript_8558:541-1191(-)